MEGGGYQGAGQGWQGIGSWNFFWDITISFHQRNNKNIHQ